MAINEYLEGLVTDVNVRDGSKTISKFDRQGNLMMSQGNGRYMELARRGRVFMACNSTVATLSTLSTTCTGFCLTNPVGSGKVIALLSINIASGIGPAGAAAIALAYGPRSTTAVTQTTPLIVRSGVLEAYVGVGLAASAATLPIAPVAIRPVYAAMGASSIASLNIHDDVGGAVVIPSGSNLSLSYLTTAITCQAAMTWAELDE